jgi:hypothetical protein
MLSFQKGGKKVRELQSEFGYFTDIQPIRIFFLPALQNQFKIVSFEY